MLDKHARNISAAKYNPASASNIIVRSKKNRPGLYDRSDFKASLLYRDPDSVNKYNLIIDGESNRIPGAAVQSLLWEITGRAEQVFEAGKLRMNE